MFPIYSFRRYCMKKAFLFILFFVLIKSVESTEKSPFVWIIEKEGKSSYLLGTIHSGVSLDEVY